MDITFLDGALGTMLQACGLQAGDVPEDWNVTNPGKVLDIHRQYAQAGADLMLPHVERLARIVSVPVIVKPNAGLPVVKDGKTRFTVDPETFARHVVRLAEAGAAFVGGRG